ncbi:MAG: hypothetical protein OEW12_05865 [Deltaproteobacteria bacterium]|nr:hypothetical protein [Deltaproteobacteria bacterium]
MIKTKFLRKWGFSALFYAAITALLAFHLALWPGPAQGQGQGRKEKFYQLDELIKLFKIAKESGFSEQQLHEITIEDEGKTINAWDYLQKLLAKKEGDEKRQKMLMGKIYLSVQEVMDELNEKNPEDLTQLRKSMLLNE